MAQVVRRFESSKVGILHVPVAGIEGTVVVVEEDGEHGDPAQPFKVILAWFVR